MSAIATKYIVILTSVGRFHLLVTESTRRVEKSRCTIRKSFAFIHGTLAIPMHLLPPFPKQNKKSRDRKRNENEKLFEPPHDVGRACDFFGSCCRHRPRSANNEAARRGAVRMADQRPPVERGRL